MRLSKEMLEYIENKAEELRATHSMKLTHSLVYATIQYMQECAKEVSEWRRERQENSSD